MNNIEQLEQQAINSAVNSRWEEAIEFNKQIIAQDENNIDAYLRLGFAYLQSNQIEQAKKYYKKALKLQPANQVANENLERIKILKEKTNKKDLGKQVSLDPNLFLEISGKTKSVILVNLGQKDILAQLTAGQEVFLQHKKRRIEVRTKNREYIGSLPDDISKRLSIFIKAGSTYTSYVKEANLNRIVIFIREENKAAKVTRYTSFPRNIQAQLEEMSLEEEQKEPEEEEFAENDIDKLAEALTSEEKEYIPYQSEEEEEEDEE